MRGPCLHLATESMEALRTMRADSEFYFFFHFFEVPQKNASDFRKLLRA
jgi:hypothetical protein